MGIQLFCTVKLDLHKIKCHVCKNLAHNRTEPNVPYHQFDRNTHTITGLTAIVDIADPCTK